MSGPARARRSIEVAMSTWHAVTDSDAVRWIVKRSPGRHVVRSAAYRRLSTERHRIQSSYVARRDPELFADVRAFCCFIGHNKCGSSMLGGLLDAHPRIVMSDEIDALHYVDAGFRREQLFALLQRGATAEARNGRVTARRLQPYSYAVPGQWQGRAQRPLVVGDTTTGTTTRRLGTDRALLDHLHRAMGDVEVKFVQVIRNPFDPISVMMVRGHRSFRNAIDNYFTACDALVDLRRRVDGHALFPAGYEDFVRSPQRTLAALCEFLGVETDHAYLSACAGIIRPTPDRSRSMVEWTSRWIDEVERRSASYDFLRGYSYAC
jgi:hypothetical protein